MNDRKLFISSPKLLVIGGILCFLCSIIILSDRQKSNSLSLTASPQQVDFGAIEANDTQACYCTITLRNNYSKDIIITQVKASCGCTLSDVAAGTILSAGKAIPMHISLSLSNHYGYIHSSVSVSGTVRQEGTSVSTEVKVKAVSMIPAFIEPQSTTFPKCFSGDPSPTGSITILHGDSIKYKWDDIDVDASKLTVTSKVISRTGITVTFSPRLDSHILGGFNDFFQIHLLNNGKRIKYQALTSNVSWEVANPDLIKAPQMIYLGAIHRSETKSGKIIIESANHIPVTSLSVTTSEPASAEVECHQLRDDMIEVDCRTRGNSYTGQIAYFLRNEVLLNGSRYCLQTPVVGYVVND